MKEHLEPQAALAPLPVVMVSCGTKEDANITTVAWTGIINSNPPLVYISLRPERHSYEIIKQNMEFVINIPDKNLVYEADYCGTKSGRNEDKFKAINLTMEDSTKVKAPAIEECPISLECKVKEIKELGSHHMFIAEIIFVNAKEEIIDENGKIDYLKAGLLSYLGTDYVVADNKIASRGICLK